MSEEIKNPSTNADVNEPLEKRVGFILLKVAEVMLTFGLHEISKALRNK